MPSGFKLAYVDLQTPSLGDVMAYFGGVLGAMQTERTGEVAYFSVGLDHHNVAIRQGERAALAAIGLQINPNIRLGDVVGRLPS